MISGSIPALISPMKADGSLDLAAYEKFVAWQIDEGSHGLVPTGTTGENPCLSFEEQTALIKIAVEVSHGRVPVIAGTGSNSTLSTVHMTQTAEKLGADAALIVVPYYNKPTEEGLFAHFKAIHDQTHLPILLYNVPGRTVVDMSVALMARLFELPRIIGVKDATGDLERVARQRLDVGASFTQLSGEDATAVGFNAMGGTGCISVTANIAPRLCAEMQMASLEGDYQKARALQDRLLPLHRAMFCETNPAPVKYAASLLGHIPSPMVRLPLVPLSKAGRMKVEQALQIAGLLG